MSLDRKLEIKEILLKSDRTIKWLSTKLPGVDLYYQLGENSKTFDVDLYDKIKALFKKEGIILSENNKCQQLLQQIIHTDAVIGHSLMILNSNVYDFTKDNILDYKEKKRLSETLDKIENEFTSEIAKSRKIIEGT